MAISRIVCRGFGSFGGGIYYVVIRGFGNLVAPTFKSWFANTNKLIDQESAS